MEAKHVHVFSCLLLLSEPVSGQCDEIQATQNCDYIFFSPGTEPNDGATPSLTSGGSGEGLLKGGFGASANPRCVFP